MFFSLCQRVSLSLSLSLLSLNSFCLSHGLYIISSSLSHSHHDTLSLSTYLFCFSCHVFFCFSFSMCPSDSLFLSPIFSVLFPFLCFFVLSWFLFFFHSFLSLFFPLSLSFCVDLPLSLSLSVSMSPFYECVPIPFSLSQCLRNVHHVLPFVTTLVSLSVSLMAAAGFLCIDTTFVSLFFFAFGFFIVSHSVCQDFNICFSLSLGDRYSNANCKLNMHGARQGISHSMCKGYTILMMRIGTLLPECKNQCWCMSTGHTW